MSILDAVIQGIIQGLTEFLPISSSGHLSLYQHFTGLGGEAGGIYAVLLHLGTLLAVFLAFWKTIVSIIIEFFYLIWDLVTGRFHANAMPPQRRMLLMLILSCVPLIGAYFLSDFYTALAADRDILVEGVCFLLTAALLFLSGRCVKGHKDAETMTKADALAVGITQAIAPLPGLSRSGSTISVGLLCGLSREYAVAYSFILGMPAVLAANLLEIPEALSGGVAINWPAAIIGMVVSLVFGLLAIKLVKLLVENDRFTYFAWYMLLLGILTVGAGIYENATGSMLFSL
ncbi:MAG TPA: undecaprenyl-diphosphate phosphatase [Oscillospiraceae bacterium]|jgi:undecaprenyl-diphosphatase|nr:undecaprenyl-diphosphate phosphatase [Oscillospiraceae bacterium]HRW56987.1 undecaprenyl-diphosphate phosphatase [Oscillospiraceae bacterium]